MNDLTLRARVMYPHVHSPHKFNPEDEEMYRATIVIDQNDPAVQQIQALTQQLVAQELDGVQPTPDNLPLKIEQDNEAVAGCFVIRAKSKQKPRVVDKSLTPIMDVNCPEDGDWCWFGIRLYSYNTRGNKGVSAALNGVMYDAKGDKKLGTGGPPSAQQMFGQVAGQPQQQAAPPNPFGTPQ